ncbi:MAG: DUF6883 domain-containing protein [Chloroflexota bacterium]
MPKIPNAENAYVDERKLTEYILNQEHPKGRHKAKVFESKLGLTKQDADLLVDALLKAVQNYDALLKNNDNYGQRYQIDFELITELGTETVRSGWIIRTEEDFPRFLSCYIT